MDYFLFIFLTQLLHLDPGGEAYVPLRPATGANCTAEFVFRPDTFIGFQDSRSLDPRPGSGSTQCFAVLEGTVRESIQPMPTRVKVYVPSNSPEAGIQAYVGAVLGRDYYTLGFFPEGVTLKFLHPVVPVDNVSFGCYPPIEFSGLSLDRSTDPKVRVWRNIAKTLSSPSRSTAWRGVYWNLVQGDQLETLSDQFGPFFAANNSRMPEEQMAELRSYGSATPFGRACAELVLLRFGEKSPIPFTTALAALKDDAEAFNFGGIGDLTLLSDQQTPMPKPAAQRWSFSEPDAPTRDLLITAVLTGNNQPIRRTLLASLRNFNCHILAADKWQNEDIGRRIAPLLRDPDEVIRGLTVRLLEDWLGKIGPTVKITRHSQHDYEVVGLNAAIGPWLTRFGH